MRIAAGADHGGFAVKQAVVRRLRSQGHEVVDVGTDSGEVSVDYPVYGHRVAELVAAGEVVRGDCRRISTHAASSSEVFPWALRPTSSVVSGCSSRRASVKQRKSRTSICSSMALTKGLDFG